MSMTKEQRQESLRRKIAAAQQKQADWQRKLAEHPDATARQRGVWRAQVVRWQHEADALRQRLAQVRS